MGYTATGNVDATISIAVTTTPTGAESYTWSASVDDSDHTAGATTVGTATVEVSGLSGTENAQTFSGGVATVTVTSL